MPTADCPHAWTPTVSARTRTGRLALFVLLLAWMAAPGRGAAADVDTWGMARQQCHQLRLDGEYRQAFDCLQDLWTEHRTELSLAGQTDVLRQMAELFSIKENPSEAQRCYEAILSLDPHWLPDDFDLMPASWREPIIEAYRARGYLMRSPGLRNIAVLDFQVSDLMPSGTDLSSLATALPTYVSSYLQQALDGARLKGDDTPIKFVSYRDRGMLMQAITQSQGAQDADVLTVASLDTPQLLRAGQLQAVQGFLRGTIIRSPDGKVQIAVQLLSVETAEVLCPKTEQGKDKDLFKLLQKALQDWVGCALDGVDLPDEGGPGQLGSMAQGVLALEQYHQALALAEQERFSEALELARAALKLRPEAEDIAQLVLLLGSQQEMAGLAAGAVGEDLPAAKLE